jgi:3-methyladenine DNA glycosylase AlkD
MVDDPEWFIQKAIGWWLRELSKHNPPRVAAFLQVYGARMKPFARREASKYLTSR